ncbi:MAG: response regulator transcription factor [Candidatus Obscuribacterales bacterium]|nr:response regulator transcription factor [Candidatus Obscuribacterales bacterium]
MSKILLVEDDLALKKSLKVFLSRQNYVVEAVETAEDALFRLKSEQYDLIILDWGLPDMTGIDVLNRYRSGGGMTPVLMLTGKNQAVDKATGLDSGADDYLTKPFENVELVARLRALLRRPQTIKSTVLSLGNVSLDVANGIMQVDDRKCSIFPKEFSLLEFLMRNPNHTFPADVLLERVWSTESEVTPDSIRAYITKIRKRLEAEKASIQITTRKGFGYVLESNVE